MLGEEKNLKPKHRCMPLQDEEREDMIALIIMVVPFLDASCI